MKKLSVAGFTFALLLGLSSCALAASPTHSIMVDPVSLAMGTLQAVYEQQLTPARGLELGVQVAFASAGGVTVGGLGGDAGLKFYLGSNSIRGFYFEPMIGVASGTVVSDFSVNLIGARAGAAFGWKGIYSGFTVDVQAGGQVVYAQASSGGYGLSSVVTSPLLAARVGYSW